jgi:hypothetical protein
MKALILIAALIAAPAFADVSASAGSQSGAAALSGSSSIASSNPIAGASAISSAGNAQNITFNSSVPQQQTIEHTGTSTVEHTGTSTIKTVPMVYAPPMGVTAPCRVAIAGGVSVVGFGMAGGGSVSDAPCNLRELARSYVSVNNMPKSQQILDGALALECQDENTAKALGALCPDPNKKPDQIAAVTPIPVIQPAAIANTAPKQSKAEADPVKTSKQTCRTEVSKSGIKTTVCSE